MLYPVLILIIAGFYLFLKHYKGKPRTYSGEQPQQAGESTEKEQEMHHEISRSAETPAAEEKVPMYCHMARFLGAVKVTRDSGGEGTIMLRMNEDGNTFSMHGHYCNYSCMSCRDKLLRDGSLRFPGMKLVEGGDEDSFNYDIDSIEMDGYSFSLKYLTGEIQEYLPGVPVTPTAERADFVSVTFRT